MHSTDLQGAGQLGRARHASTSSTPHRAAQPVPLPGAGDDRRHDDPRRQAVAAINPEEASHTFAVPELGVFVPLPGVSEEAKNPCEDGALRTSYDHGRSPSASARQEGPLPLAVLRALRARATSRQRRADADARLHGRLHRCGLAVEPSDPKPRPPLRLHLARRDARRHAAGRSCCSARSCRRATAATRPPGT